MHRTSRRSHGPGGSCPAAEELDARGRRLRAANAAVVVAIHGPATTLAYGQPRLAAAGIHASHERGSADPGAEKSDDADGSRPPAVDCHLQRRPDVEDSGLWQIAEAHTGQITSANDRLLLVMAEQFRAACR
jgi:hypothetical protein